MCYTGFVRFPTQVWINNHKPIIDEMRNSGIEIDIFFHTWKNDELTKEFNIFAENENEDTIIKELYNPKLYKVDDVANYEHLQPKFFGQHISTIQSIELSKQYEQQNNIKYDFKMKMRSDAVMQDFRIENFLRELKVSSNNFWASEEEKRKDHLSDFCRVIWAGALYYDFYQGNIGDYFLFSTADVMDKWMSVENLQYVIDNYHTDKDIHQAVNADSQNRVFLFMIKSAFVDDDQFNNPYFYMPFMDRNNIRIHKTSAFNEFLFRDNMTADDIKRGNEWSGRRLFTKQIKDATLQKISKGRFRNGRDNVF